MNHLRTTISGLRKYTNYSMTVLAYTAVGDGARSLPVYCQTEEDGKIILKNDEYYLKVQLPVV